MELFDEHVIRSALAEPDAFQAVKRAYQALAAGHVSQPGPIGLSIQGASPGELSVVGAHIKGAPIFIVKTECDFQNNATRGGRPTSGMTLVFDAETGVPVAALADNGYLTDLGMGASGALAVDLLAPETLGRVAFIGCGSQARYQARAIGRVRAWNEARVWCEERADASEFCQELAATLDRPFSPSDSVEEAVRGADLVVTATRALAPLVSGAWLSEHATVVAVGSHVPGVPKSELEVDVLGRADKLVTDDWNRSIRFGEIHRGVAANVLSLRDIHAELGKVLTGERSAREGSELIVCDLVGVGAQDAAIAELAWRRLSAPELV